MKNLLLLLKVDLITTINLNKFKNSKNTFKKVGIIFLIIVVLATAMLNTGLYSYLSLDFLMQNQISEYFLPLAYILSSFAIFYSTIYRAKSYLFGCEENLFAMPINTITLLISKVLTLIILNFGILTLIYIPAYIVYGVTLKLGLTYFIYGFIGYLFMPILPTIIGGVIGYFIGYLSLKFKNKKIFETVLTYLLFLIIMYIIMNIQNLAMKFVNNIEVINKLLESLGFVINSFMQMIVNYSLKDLIIYMVVNLLSLIIFVLIFNKSYVNINQKLKEEKTKNKYTEKDHKNKGTIAALLRRELKTYISIPIYILNTSFGIIMLFFASISTLFYDKSLLFNILELDENATPLYLLVLLVTAFSVAMSITTVCSISIEGKKIWILKTLPIKTSDIFISKVLLNVMVVLPISLISIIIFGLSFKLSLLEILTLILLIILINLTVSIFGLIVNLKFNRLDFNSYVKVVKQSLSTFIGVMVPLIMFFIIVSIYGVINISIQKYVGIISTLLFTLIMVQCYILKKWGIPRFKEIN